MDHSLSHPSCVFFQVPSFQQHPSIALHVSSPLPSSPLLSSHRIPSPLLSPLSSAMSTTHTLRRRIPQAIAALGERRGSTRQAIMAWVKEHEAAENGFWEPYVTSALLFLCRTGKLLKTKSGRFRLSPPTQPQPQGKKKTTPIAEEGKEAAPVAEEAVQKNEEDEIVAVGDLDEDMDPCPWVANPDLPTPSVSDQQMLDTCKHLLTTQCGYTERELCIMAAGHIDNMHHALMLGHADTCQGFKGKVDWEGRDYYYHGYTTVPVPYEVYTEFVDGDDECWCGHCSLEEDASSCSSSNSDSDSA